MTDSVLPLATGQDTERLQRWITRFVFGLAIATWGLMGLGSATRVMNAGLSCPDWPLCYGTLLPQQMNLQIFLEWFHRLVASTIGGGTIVLVGLCWQSRQILPKGVPALATGALGLIIFQGMLGGLTVTELLRFDIVTAHLATGLLFFSTLLTLGMVLLPRSATSDLTPEAWLKLKRIRWFGLAAVICVYGQSILGGVVASRWALHQCFGIQQLCTVMNSHLIGVIPASLSTIALVFVAMRSKALSQPLRYLIHGVGMVLFLQLLLGVATFYLHLQVEPLTIAHQMIGALLLGTLVLFTGFTFSSVAFSSTHP